MAQVKGSAVLARMQFIEERFGPGASTKLRSALDSSAQAALDARILPHSWVPYDLFVDLSVRIDELFGNGDLSLCYELGRYAAGVNLPTLYRIFYKLGTPHFIFRKAARVWEVHYDSGRLIPTEEGEKAIRIKILDFDRPHRAHCLSVKGWAARSIEMSGAVLDSIKEERCRLWGDGACEMTLSWK